MGGCQAKNNKHKIKPCLISEYNYFMVINKKSTKCHFPTVF